MTRPTLNMSLPEKLRRTLEVSDFEKVDAYGAVTVWDSLRAPGVTVEVLDEPTRNGISWMMFKIQEGCPGLWTFGSSCAELIRAVWEVQDLVKLEMAS
jgi:hypothetical protein